MNLTFSIWVVYWSRPTSHLSSRVLVLSTAELLFFSTKGHGNLDHDLCPWGYLMMTNIPSKFEGLSPKHCQDIKLFNTKGPGTLTFALRIIYWAGPLFTPGA